MVSEYHRDSGGEGSTERSERVGNRTIHIAGDLEWFWLCRGSERERERERFIIDH